MYLISKKFFEENVNSHGTNFRDWRILIYFAEEIFHSDPFEKSGIFCFFFNVTYSIIAGKSFSYYWNFTLMMVNKKPEKIFSIYTAFKIGYFSF